MSFFCVNRSAALCRSPRCLECEVEMLNRIEEHKLRQHPLLKVNYTIPVKEFNFREFQLNSRILQEAATVRDTVPVLATLDIIKTVANAAASRAREKSTE